MAYHAKSQLLYLQISMLKVDLHIHGKFWVCKRQCYVIYNRWGYIHRLRIFFWDQPFLSHLWIIPVNKRLGNFRRIQFIATFSSMYTKISLRHNLVVLCRSWRKRLFQYLYKILECFSPDPVNEAIQRWPFSLMSDLQYLHISSLPRFLWEWSNTEMTF